jgi:hypothetical protein
MTERNMKRNVSLPALHHASSNTLHQKVPSLNNFHKTIQFAEAERVEGAGKYGG